MPLVKGKKAKTREGFSENVRREMDAGKEQRQAVAIAYSQAREGKKKAAPKKKVAKKKVVKKAAPKKKAPVKKAIKSKKKVARRRNIAE